MEIDKEMERIDEMMVEASCIVARYVFAHCLAKCSMDLKAANEMVVAMADEYRDALVEAVRKLIADAGPSIAAHVAAEECINRAANGGSIH